MRGGGTRVLAVLATLGCVTLATPTAEPPVLLPEVRQWQGAEGPGFQVPERLSWAVPRDWPRAAEHLRLFGAALARWSGCSLTEQPSAAPERAALEVVRAPDLPPEAYRLEIGPRLRIEAGSLKGLAHATATLLQSWAPAGDTLPAARVHDAPANPWRSLLVDLGRHPMSLEGLHEILDLLWFYKLDSLHLHLTDDQRFAFPTTAFPGLVRGPGQLSREDFVALERAATLRGVTLIPELEVPGHSTLLRRHYPEVFGRTPTELATLETARAGLRTLLDEILEVFPSSPYVHIGGDEAYGVRADIQRDLINDLQAYLRARGRTAVVWEGPGPGEGANRVDPEVIHMNWRTVNYPADRMLADGYRVVNAAWDPLYVVDHYPANNFTMAAPGWIYRRLDRRRFGHFNPDMPTFLHPVVVDPSPRLLGYSMCWWEGREENFFPLVPPRLAAMAAVAWAEPALRDEVAFAAAARRTEARRRLCFYPVGIQAEPLAVASAGVFWDRTTIHLVRRDRGGEDARGSIRYTLDGSAPTAASAAYEGPLEVRESILVRAALFVDGRQVGHGSRRRLTVVHPRRNLALGKEVTASVPAGPIFCPARLTDGGLGNLDQFLGYPAAPDPIRVTVDLGEIRNVNEVVVHSYLYGNSYESYEVELSADGERWRQVADRRERPEQPAAASRHRFPETAARYVRILTWGHPGQVFDSFSRMTEIEVFGPEP